MKKLILCSASASRLKLLKTIGFVPHEIVPLDIDESWHKNEAPRALAVRLAWQKAEHAFNIMTEKEGKVLLAADTVVSVGRQVVDKALTDDDVRARMQMLSGRNQRIYSAFCMVDVTSEKISGCKVIAKCIETRIKFKKLTDRDIEQMVATGDGIGKAGGWAIDGFSESFVITISGSVSNIIGFSTYHVRNCLLSLGLGHD